MVFHPFLDFILSVHLTSYVTHIEALKQFENANKTYKMKHVKQVKMICVSLEEGKTISQMGKHYIKHMGSFTSAPQEAATIIFILFLYFLVKGETISK